MKKFSLALSLLGLMAGSAVAADMPVKAAYKAPVVSVYSWTGCYIGGNGGGLWVRKDWNVTATGAVIGSHDANSWVAGVQAGCDYQFAGGFVIGIQGDYDWTNAQGTNVDQVQPAWTDRTTVKSVSTVTARVGYAWDRFLGYVKGGAAWERDSYDVYVTATNAAVRTAAETRNGWTVGIGGEYAFTNFLSAFVEYNYYNFGTRTVTFSDAAQADIRERKSVARVGLNLRFGGGPVVARY
jgi:outer membrane immunogenic protein